MGTEGWIGNSLGLVSTELTRMSLRAAAFARPPSSVTVNPPPRGDVAKPIHYTLHPGSCPWSAWKPWWEFRTPSPRRPATASASAAITSPAIALPGFALDNRPETYGIWRADGANPQVVPESFSIAANSIVELLRQLPDNRWSAELDGVPLFDNAPFTATTQRSNSACSPTSGVSLPRGHGLW